MLIHNKRVFTFMFIFKEEEYEVTYTKEFNPSFDDIINDFEVMGDIKNLSKVIEILEKNQLEISELLESDLELESIDYKELYNYQRE